MTLQPGENLDLNRYEFVQRFISARPAQTPDAVVFDIGAGAFPMRDVIEAAGYGLRGFDLVPRHAEISRWDVTEPFASPERADIVLLMDVIEHTFNPGLALANIRAVLKPGGTLVMTMPNPRWSRARTLHLFTGYIAAFTEHDLVVNHHVFPTWPHVIAKMCDDAGLSLESYATLDGKEGEGFSLSPFRWVELGVRKLIESFDKTACGMSYVLVLRAPAA